MPLQSSTRKASCSQLRESSLQNPQILLGRELINDLVGIGMEIHEPSDCHLSHALSWCRQACPGHMRAHETHASLHTGLSSSSIIRTRRPRWQMHSSQNSSRCLLADLISSKTFQTAESGYHSWHGNSSGQSDKVYQLGPVP